MSAKDLRYNAEARAALLAGIDAVADAVKVTLGPKGRNVMLALGGGDVIVTNDGVTIAGEIELEPLFERQGARLVKEVARATNDLAGDGTTTATLLAQAIVRHGVRNVAAGADPVALRRGIELAVSQVAAHLRDVQAVPVDSRELIARVASISAGENEVGELIGEAFADVGNDAVVRVEFRDTPGRRARVHRGHAVARRLRLAAPLRRGRDDGGARRALHLDLGRAAPGGARCPTRARAVIPTGRPLLILAEARRGRGARNARAQQEAGRAERRRGADA